MRGHRQDSAQKWGLPCRWLFLFFLGKNRCETDLCSNKIGGDNHTKTIQESKTGVEFILRPTHQTAQLQRTLPPLHPLLQAELLCHRGGLSPLWKQAQHKVPKHAPKHRNFRRSVAVMKVSAAEINAPYTRRKQQNTHPFPAEKDNLRFYLANGANRQRSTISLSKA